MTEPASARAPSLFSTLRSVVLSIRDVTSLFALLRRGWSSLTHHRPAPREDDPETRDLFRRAGDARTAGRRDEATILYRAVRDRNPDHVGALRALRDLAAESARWPEALDAEETLVDVVPVGERRTEHEWLAAFHYEQGRQDLSTGNIASAVGHFRQSIKVDREFVPASLALGDALEAGGELREAVRVWERAVDRQPSLPLLARLERAYRLDGRPSRMISLYQSAAMRAPDDLSIAVALGRVYFELEMLDEAADHFERLEVRAREFPVVHAFLGAIFEKRGEVREAFEEYRRALRQAQAFTWPHRCRDCGTVASTWEDRCPRCGHWNSLRPVAVPI